MMMSLILAYKMKEEIKEKFGFTVNIGIGIINYVHKMAGDFPNLIKFIRCFQMKLKKKCGLYQ